MRRYLYGLCVWGLLTGTATAAEWYVSPTGNGSGTQASPMSLATALGGSSPARPGDTIWLRAGTYSGAFTSVLKGTATAQITVSGYPKERATLDGNNAAAKSAGTLLNVQGAYTTFRDFEVLSSDAARTDQNTGYGNFPSGIDINTSVGIKLVNLVVHDMVGKGIGAWVENTGAEIYGCIIYYNGMSDHDHGIYVQNSTGTKVMSDNVIFDQASHGIHGYAQEAALNNLTIEGNAVFENGILIKQSSRNILLGGGTVAQNGVVRDNYTFFRLTTMGNSNVGYAAGAVNAVITGNYWVGGNAAVRLVALTTPTVTGNTFVGALDPSDTATRWPSNTFQAAHPTSGQKVIVRTNKYEAGRSMVIVYNWAKTTSVSVDLSTSGLVNGDQFEIRSVFDYFGTPLLTGTYTGAAATVPMTGTMPKPIGTALSTPATTLPEFGVFIVRKTGTTTTVNVAPPLPPTNVRVLGAQ